MSAPDRRAMVERPGSTRVPPCALVGGRAEGRPPEARRRSGRSGGDAPDRRTASRTSVLRLAANDLRTQPQAVGQPQTGAAADAGDGDRGAGSAPRHEQGRARAQDIPLPAARPEDCRAEPRVGGRRDLHPDGVRLPLSGGDHRLGQPGGSGMAAVEHQRCELLARRRWRRRCFGSESRGFSIPIRAPLSPPRLSSASSRRPASRFRWTDAAASWTTFSSNGCGARSSMKRCI